MMIDRDEQKIRKAFSQIQVDTESLERKVRENMNTKKIIKPTPLKRTGFAAAASIEILIFLSVSVYAAATLGVFDRFMEEHDPAFGEVVTPVEMYTVEDGIRIDIIAAQTFGNNALMYLSVQDVSGQNRVTEYANIAPFMNLPRDEERLMGIGIFGGMAPFYFDAATNTAYFQLEFQDVVDIPNVFELIISDVRFETRRTEMDFPVALSALSSAQTVQNPMYIPGRDFPTWCAEYILVPSMGDNFPALPGDGWISNAAIINGNLHVQIATPVIETTELGGRSANGNVISGATLTQNGNMVAPINQSFVQVDANLQGLSLYQQQSMSPEELGEWVRNAPYHISEVVFPIDITALESYSLTLIGMFEHSVAGNWTMTVCTGETSGQMRLAASDVIVGGAVVESVMVTPLGVSFSGIVDGGIADGAAAFRGRSIYIETPAGNILVQENPSVVFSEMYGTDAIFTGFARSESPIDVAEVTAVVIGDVRVAVE